MESDEVKLFHKFIEITASQPEEINKIPQFQYMNQSIRKAFKQLKKTKSKSELKPSEKFVQYFKDLSKEEQVIFYIKWAQLLDKCKQNTYKKSNLQKKQAQLYIKKSSVLNSWQKKKVVLSNLNFCIIQSKKTKQYPLKYYTLRKSRNKQHFGWVLQLLYDKSKSNLKNLHCGTNNIKEFQQWYQLLQRYIDEARIQYFQDVLFKNNKNPIINNTYVDESDNQQSEQNENQKNLSLPKQYLNKPHQQYKVKTVTQTFIDSHMKNAQGIDDIIVEQQKKNHQSKDQQQNGLKSSQTLHPNVFRKLLPNFDIDKFPANIMNSTLLHGDSSYQLLELPVKEQNIFRLRISLMIPLNKSLVFLAITQENHLWNNEIEVFSVKTKISSQNSALIYQKDKSQGFLYRERDFLFLRHCFSLNNTQKQKQKIIIIDKSIDSISFPPFMSVARGQKQLIWGIIGNNDDKECMLVIQGWVKGGGYMNTANDKDMTIKYFKKLLNLQGYLKHKKFLSNIQNSNQNVFKEHWNVKMEQQEQQFYDVQNLQQKNQQIDNQFKQFIKKTSQQNIDNYQSNNQQENQIAQDMQQVKQQNYEKKKQQKPVSQFDIQAFTPPKFKSDNTVIIPQTFLKVKHIMNPIQKPAKQSLYPHVRDHHLWKGEWAISPSGGLNYVDQKKMNQQKKVLTFIIKRIGKNILSGKGILNISLPVDIFCRESNIQRLAASFGFAPFFLEKAATLTDPKQQLKLVVATGISSSLIYLTMEKPFNPILGQTYQSWIDNCPIYFEQISHHPPIAAYLMYGRGYKLSGTVQAKMDLSINSGTGINEGIFTVQFDNGRKIYYTTAAGQLSGLTYGERKLLLVGKTFYWCVQQGLFLELQFNPSSKNRRFFGGNNLVGDQKLHDYVQGTLKKFSKQQLQQHLIPKKGDYRKIMALPKEQPKVQCQQQLMKFSGRWTKYLEVNGEKIFDIDQNRYYTMKDQENPLPSHSNYRQDVVYRRLNNFVLSQQFKQIWQVQQRKDRKLRQQYMKKNK